MKELDANSDEPEVLQRRDELFQSRESILRSASVPPEITADAERLHSYLGSDSMAIVDVLEPETAKAQHRDWFTKLQECTRPQ